MNLYTCVSSLILYRYNERYKVFLKTNETLACNKLELLNSPVPWAGISRVFHGYGELDHSRRSIFAGTVRWDNLRGRITSLSSLLLYILVVVPMPVKYPPMELRELHTRGRGRVSPAPYP